MKKILALAAAGLLLLSGCSQTPKDTKTQASDFVLNTVATITIYKGGEDPSAIIKKTFDLCREKEKVFSRTVAGSDIDRINQAKGQPVTVSEETAALLQKAVYYGDLSGGLFDVTIAPAAELWDFSGDPHIPDADALAEAVSHVDYTGIHIDGTTVTLSDPQAAIDLGGIAKGYISGLCADYLRSQGVESAIVDLGGNVVTVGGKPDGDAFTVGVQKPFSSDLAATLPATDLAVVTSGDYERYFEQDGKLYHHILDPATGYPVDTGLSAVTIVTANPTDADALSTVCFLLGEEKGLALIEGLDGVEALFIAADGTLTATSGLTYTPE